MRAMSRNRSLIAKRIGVALIALVGLTAKEGVIAVCFAADASSPSSGELLFEDSFERAELGPGWDVHPDSFEIVFTHEHVLPLPRPTQRVRGWVLDEKQYIGDGIGLTE